MAKLPLKLDPDFHRLHRNAEFNEQRRKLLLSTFQKQEQHRVRVETIAALVFTAIAVSIIAYRMLLP